MRTLPNLGLQGAFADGEDGWGDEMNASLLKLSSLVQATVSGRLAAVPGSPAQGDMVVLTAAPNANAVAVYDDGAWTYYAPTKGWLVYDRGTDDLLLFDGAAWSEFAGSGGGGGGGGGGGARYAYQVPAVADFTVSLDQNPGRTFANAQSGGIWLHAGQGYRTKTFVSKACPVNRRVRMKCRGTGATVAYYYAGLGIAEAASPNNVIAVAWYVDGFNVSMARWNGAGNNAAAGYGIAIPQVWDQDGWFEIEITATQIVGRFSPDGALWYTIGTAPRGDLAAGDLIVGPYLFSTPGNGGSQGLLVSHFEIGAVDMAYPTLANL